MNELLKDICSRIPYGLKVCVPHISVNSVFNLIGVQAVDKELTTAILTRNNGIIHVPINLVKPYLFPLSSMNEKQIEEFYRIKGLNLSNEELIKFKSNHLSVVSCISSYNWSIDWLNKNHFDYRNLINQNLAIDCTNLNIY